MATKEVVGSFLGHEGPIYSVAVDGGHELIFVNYQEDYLIFLSYQDY